MSVLKYLHRGKSPFATYTVLFGLLCLVVCRVLDATLADPDTLARLLIPLELIIFVAPVAVYAALSRSRPSPSELYLTPPRLAHLPLLLVASAFLICGALALTVAVCGSDISAESFSLYSTFRTRGKQGFANAAYLVVTYAALPALCEELTFRGFLCSRYGFAGRLNAVAASSLLFAAIHLDLQMFPIYLLSGALLCLVMYATGSVSVSALIHFVYNLFCIFVQPYIISFYVYTSSRPLFIMLVVALTLASGAVTFWLLSGLYAAHRGQHASVTALAPIQRLNGLSELTVSLPFIACMLVFVLAVLLT